MDFSSLSVSISAINDTAIIDALLLCFLLDVLSFLYTHVQNNSFHTTIDKQQQKIKELQQQAFKLKEKGITRVFVEFRLVFLWRSCSGLREQQ